MPHNRNPRTGGRIPPQGRTPTAGGVGKKARRHDLERPRTPGLSDSSLQQGDVQRLEQAQAVAPRAGAGKRVQPNAIGGQPQARGAAQRTVTGGMQIPDPIEFAKGRLGGGLGASAATDIEGNFRDPTDWLPLLNALASHPQAGGGLTSTFVQQLSNLVRRPSPTNLNIVNLNDLDDALEAGLNE